MGDESGVYVIRNKQSGNAYCGIAQNMSTRFGSRMETITEMDIGAAVMSKIGVAWGKVYVSARQNNTTSRPATEISPGWNSLTTQISWMDVDLERLLIRTVASHVTGVKTISNNVKTSLYENTSGRDITVILEMAAIHGVSSKEDFWVTWVDGGKM
jgi:hypothetical protein